MLFDGLLTWIPGYVMSFYLLVTIAASYFVPDCVMNFREGMCERCCVGKITADFQKRVDHLCQTSFDR